MIQSRPWHDQNSFFAENIMPAFNDNIDKNAP